MHDGNVYQYYLSTSNSELKDGEWKYYVSDEMFSINGTNETKYLWVYPIRDKVGNINDNKTFGKPYVIGTYVFDSTKPVIAEENTIVNSGGTVILNVSDSGGSELASDNVYQYYLSTSNTELKGGEWKNYKSGEAFAVSGVSQTKYLWIYPIKDKSGNINGDYNSTSNPYVISSYIFKMPYTLTIDLNGGTGSMKDSYTLYENDTIDVSNPTKENYIFEGWSVSGTGSKLDNGIFTMGTSDATLTANWKANNYTIVYNCNGGSGSTASSSHTYDSAKNLTSNGCYKIVTGTGTGTSATPMVYYLAGWSKSSSATNATYTNGQSVTNVGTSGTVTLYAVWKKAFTYTKKYEVISDGSGNWRIKFFETGTYASATSLNIDIFCVGGGGGGGYADSGTCSGGGGGGYTTTVKAKTLSSNANYTVTIGGGGAMASTIYSTSATGGTSSFGSLASAAGGKGGVHTNVASGRAGGAGGSGGTAFGSSSIATDGANGSNSSSYGSKGGAGQGTTTKEFGETSGQLYASGGNGACPHMPTNPGASTSNSGNGGNTGYAGGSGIVVIRNKR